MNPHAAIAILDAMGAFLQNFRGQINKKPFVIAMKSAKAKYGDRDKPDPREVLTFIEDTYSENERRARL